MSPEPPTVFDSPLRPPPFPRDASIAADDVHVIEFDLDDSDPPPGLSCLDETERARAARFVHDVDRRRFVVAHTITRVVLGICHRVGPAVVRFTISGRGKPRVAGSATDVRFNLSHSGGRGLLAVGIGRELGIDVEQHRPIDVLELGRSVFSRGEQAALASLPPDERMAAFYRCWTRKESFIKALGEGLFMPLDAFDVSLGVDTAQALLACRHSSGNLAQWSIVPLTLDETCAAALTVEGAPPRRIIRWRAPAGFGTSRGEAG